MDKVEQLEKLAKLKESGALTEEEFQREKKALLEFRDKNPKEFSEQAEKKKSKPHGCLVMIAIIFGMSLVGNIIGTFKGDNPKELTSKNNEDRLTPKEENSKTELDLLIEEASQYIDPLIFKTFPPNTDDNKARILRIYANKLIQEKRGYSKLNNEFKLRNEKALHILNQCLNLKAPSSLRCHCSLEVVHSNLGNKKDASVSQKLCKDSVD